MGMIISNIELHNWKNFQKCTVNIAERCFVVGANASGKSNFLDALRFLRDIVKQGGGLQTAVNSRGGMAKIRCLAARAQTDVRIAVTLRDQGQQTDKWKYSLAFKHQNGGFLENSVEIIEETVFSFERNTYILKRPGRAEEEDNETLKYTHLEQANANKEFREIKDAFYNIEYLNLIPQMVREANTTEKNNDDYYGKNFLQRLAQLNETTRESYLRKVNQVVTKAVPQLDGLSFVKDKDGSFHLEAKYIHWRAKGCKQTEMQFSDGTLRLIGFLFSMLNGNGIILMEEPELNLHSGVVAQLPEFIANMQRHKKRQVFVTTHSYDILSNVGIGASEVLLLKNGNEGTEVHRISEVDEIRNELKAGFTVADAVIDRTRPSDIDRMSVVNLAE